MMSERVRYMFSDYYADPDPDPAMYPWTVRLRKKLPSTMPSEWIIGYKFGVHFDGEYRRSRLMSITIPTSAGVPTVVSRFTGSRSRESPNCNWYTPR